MKNSLLILIFIIIFCPFAIIAQNVGIGTTTPDASALLDVQSSEGGVLIPRLNTTQRNAISSPATGLLVFNETTNQFEFYTGGEWSPVANSIFEENAGVIRQKSSFDEDFIIGRNTLPLNDETVNDNFFFFDKAKGSFRGGRLNFSKNWSPDSIGNNSFAYGYETKALSDYSSALGYETEALGLYSIAMGKDSKASGSVSTTMGNNTEAIGANSLATGSGTKASGSVSTAMGNSTIASGNNSTAIGSNTIASGTGSTAMGFNTDAIGQYSTAMGGGSKATGKNSIAMGDTPIASGETSISMGRLTNASGDYSIAMGLETKATGENAIAIGLETKATGYSSTAMGSSTNATGNYSTAMGLGTTAPSYLETVIGQYNLSYTPLDSAAWNSNDPLFVIGNGNSFFGSNALVVYKNGNTGIGISNPNERLEVRDGINIKSYSNDAIFHMESENSLKNRVIVMQENAADLIFGDIDGHNQDVYFKSAGNDVMIMNNAGNVGINAFSPSEKFQVKGEINIQGETNDAILNMQSVNTLKNRVIVMQDNGDDLFFGDMDGHNRDVYFRSAGNDVMIIDNAGNVGIGDFTPAEKLEVQGNIFADGDIYTRGSNGVLNMGGGYMNPDINMISDNGPTPSNVNGDEDLYIEDDIELGSQGYKPGGGSWAAVSDMRLKREITDFTDGLDVLMHIRPVSYKYNDKIEIYEGDKEFIGVLAQEVQQVAPYMVEEKALFEKVKEDENGREIITDPGENYLTYDATALNYILVNAVKEQQQIIERLNVQLAKVIKDKIKQESRLARLESKMAELNINNN